MFCTHCGSQIGAEVSACPTCGVKNVAAKPATKFCSNCGSQISAEAETCVHCGVRTSWSYSSPTPAPAGSAAQDPLTRALAPTEGHSWVVTLLLALFGFMGLHRFYTGQIISGIFQFLTLGGLGFWWLYDLISILFGWYRDADGRLLVK